jgi:hypothetical protein
MSRSSFTLPRAWTSTSRLLASPRKSSQWRPLKDTRRVNSRWIIDVAPRVLAGLFCVALLYALTQTVFKVPIETYETAAYGVSRRDSGIRDVFETRLFAHHF